MPLLATIFITMSVELAKFFWQFFSKRIAFGLAASVTFVTMWGVLVGVLIASLAALKAVLPDWPGMDIAVWVATPPAVPAAVGTVLSVDAAIALYRWNMQNLKLITGGPGY